MATSSLLAKATEEAAISILSPSPTAPPPTFSFTPFLAAHGLAVTTNTPVCPNYLAGHCPLGRRCPNRHPTPSAPPSHYRNDNYVCKHWLKALCKKGDQCDYLHEYNLRKMSECQFYNQHGYCQNGDECLYLHVKEEARLPQCEDYNTGFCEKGPRCPKRHVRKKLCEFYLAGFCPDGKECKAGVHLKSLGPVGTGPDAEAERKRRVEDLEKREAEVKSQTQPRWRGRGGGGGGGGGGGRGGRGKWKDRRDR